MRSKYINLYYSQIALLIGFIIYGLLGKLLISLNLSLNSDSVIAGILSREMYVHNNLLHGECGGSRIPQPSGWG
jgi:hypothetical protein